MKRLGLIVGSILTVVALAFAGWRAWSWYRFPEYVQAVVPRPPADLSTKPEILRLKLEEARSQLANRAQIPAALAELGRLFHANGYVREAEICWRLLRAQQPREPHWAYYLSDLRRTQGDDAEVEKLLKLTTELAPTYSLAWLRLAELEFKTDRAALAGPHYEKRLALVPGDPYARAGLARIALAAGDRTKARQLIEQIIHDTPDFSIAHNLYAEMLAAEGDEIAARHHRFLGNTVLRFHDADDPWLLELRAWCFDPKLLCVLGTMEFLAKQGDHGLTFTARAVALAPLNSGMYEQLGDLYMKLGEFAKARDTFEACIRNATTPPPTVMIYVDLADAYRILHDSSAALQTVEKGLAAFPNSFELHNEKGAVYADAGQLPEAEAAYRRALEIAPTDTDSNYSLGLTLLSLGRKDEGVEYLKHSLHLKPTYPKALLILGRLELQAGHVDAAGQYLEPLYESHGEQPEIKQLYGLWCLRSGAAANARGDASSAEKRYRAGLAADPSNAEMNANYGVLLVTQGRFPEAVAPLEAFHRLLPKEPQADLFLGQVYASLGRLELARQLLREGKLLADQQGKRSTASHCQEILDQL